MEKARINRVASVLAVALIAIMVVSVMSALAEDAPADKMEILREKVHADKKLVVATAMQFTESEAKVFWPVYGDYQKGLKSSGIAPCSSKEESRAA